MSKSQIVHTIISAVSWIAFIIELVIINGINGWTLLLLLVGVLVSAIIINFCPSEWFLVCILLFFVIAIAVAIPMRNNNLDTQAKAIELYEQGKYEESMDEFMKIKDTGFVDEYVEEYTVYKLKGTDIERMEGKIDE